MKKILLIALGACMLTATQTTAQKQVGNEKNLQVLFAPLGGNPVSISGISFRKFNATGDAAWRVNFFFGMNNKTEILQQEADTIKFPKKDTSGDITFGTNPEAVEKTSGMTFSIRPGYEKHFAGTERLSPYIGAEILFSLTTATVTSDSVGYANSSIDVTSSAPVSVPYTIYTTERKGDGGSTTFGLNLIAGADYYIAKNLSLGVELGFGFSTTSMADITDESVKTTSTTSGNVVTTTTTVVSDPTKKQGSAMQVGPNAVAQIKLGWLF